MKNAQCCFLSLFLLVCALFPVSAAGPVGGAAAKDRPMLLGFVQVSVDGTWRFANTRSIKESAKAAGINLLYREGTNNIEKQITEMRKLIAQGVDILAFSPAQASGWDKVLREAKDAGIPVIVVERAIDVKDDSLYVTHIGADMVEEGRTAARWLVEYMKDAKGGVRIAVLEGTQGFTPTVHRKKGFEEVIREHPAFTIVRSKAADFTLAKGKDVMDEFLKAENGKIHAVFAHNDEMGLGAIEAVAGYGLKPGKDVVIVSVDGTRKAFKAMIDGTLNGTVECTPLLGPDLIKAAQDIAAGKKVSRRIAPHGRVFTASSAEKELPNRTY